jgi:hypothetical protein
LITIAAARSIQPECDNRSSTCASNISRDNASPPHPSRSNTTRARLYRFTDGRRKSWLRNKQPGSCSG